MWAIEIGGCLRVYNKHPYAYLYQDLFPSSNRTQSVSIMKTNRLLLDKEIIRIHCESRMNLINILCGKIRIFLILHRVVRLINHWISKKYSLKWSRNFSLFMESDVLLKFH
jgi:hypothetical protein